MIQTNLNKTKKKKKKNMQTYRQTDTSQLNRQTGPLVASVPARRPPRGCVPVAE